MALDSITLAETINQLVSCKQEGPNWDYKKCWYTHDEHGKQSLLHDIICMANNLENRNGYIIFGVDEEKAYEVVGVEKDENRYNTQNIVDFLREKKFAGQFRPIVSVETVTLCNVEIDVLIVHQSNNTPYYLIEDYNKKIKAYHIYTRIQDSNTPLNSSADLQYVAMLWRKRFGLDVAPLERFRQLLQEKENWLQSPGNDCLQYYKYAPEYTIEYICDDRPGEKMWHYTQIDSTPAWGKINLKYHQTILASFDVNYLDGFRFLCVCPFQDFADLDDYAVRYVPFLYFVKDSLAYDLLQFNYDCDDSGAQHSYQAFMKVVLLFETQDELESFKSYLVVEWERTEFVPNEKMLPPKLVTKRDKTAYFREEALYMQKMSFLLAKFRDTSENC